MRIWGSNSARLIFAVFLGLAAVALMGCARPEITTAVNDIAVSTPPSTNKSPEIDTGRRLTEVDLVVNGVRAGSTLAEVKKKLGKPTKQSRDHLDTADACSGEPESYIDLTYPGLELTLLKIGNDKDHSVIRIEVTSDKWDVNGISFGVTSDDVVRRFGEPHQKAADGTILHYVTLGNLGLVNFVFVDGKLVRATMAQTLC